MVACASYSANGLEPLRFHFVWDPYPVFNEVDYFLFPNTLENLAFARYLVIHADQKNTVTWRGINGLHASAITIRLIDEAQDPGYKKLRFFSVPSRLNLN